MQHRTETPTFSEAAFAHARSLLDEPSGGGEGADVDTVVTIWLAGGGPTTYVELTYSDADDWINMEPPDRAVFVHSYGTDEFRYQYPSDELDTLMERLFAYPEEDDDE